MWNLANRWVLMPLVPARALSLGLAGALAFGGCGTTVPGHLDSLEAQKTHPKIWARADTTVDEMRADIKHCGQAPPQPRPTGWAVVGGLLELGAVAGGGMSPGLVGSSADASGGNWASVERCMAHKGYTLQ